MSTVNAVTTLEDKLRGQLDMRHYGSLEIFDVAIIDTYPKFYIERFTEVHTDYHDDEYYNGKNFTGPDVVLYTDLVLAAAHAVRNVAYIEYDSLTSDDTSALALAKELLQSDVFLCIKSWNIPYEVVINVFTDYYHVPLDSLQ